MSVVKRKADEIIDLTLDEPVQEPHFTKKQFTKPPFAAGAEVIDLDSDGDDTGHVSVGEVQVPASDHEDAVPPGASSWPQPVAGTAQATATTNATATAEPATPSVSDNDDDVQIVSEHHIQRTVPSSLPTAIAPSSSLPTVYGTNGSMLMPLKSMPSRGSTNPEAHEKQLRMNVEQEQAKMRSIQIRMKAAYDNIQILTRQQGDFRSHPNAAQEILKLDKQIGLLRNTYLSLQRELNTQSATAREAREAHTVFVRNQQAASTQELNVLRHIIEKTVSLAVTRSTVFRNDPLLMNRAIDYNVSNIMKNMLSRGINTEAKFIKEKDNLHYDIVRPPDEEDRKWIDPRTGRPKIKSDNGSQDLSAYRQPDITGMTQRLANPYHAEDHRALSDFISGLKTDESEREGESLTPEMLSVNLLKHQRIGLHWLVSMEEDVSTRGGLLADDMGLGKTVQALALMLQNRATEGPKTNLIVAPVALLRQWRAEIETKVKREAEFNAFIYSSGHKVSTFEELARYDVVLVSYTTLANEMKKHMPVMDEDEAKEIGEVPDLEALDVLKKEGEYFSPFFSKEAKFYRVILDEAQYIKNKSTQSAKAASALAAHYRWCLSGTPIQNSIEELYSLVRFLRIKPYNRADKFRAELSSVLTNKKNGFDSYDRKNAMKRVRALLARIMLRRTKDSKIDGEPILTLPEKHVGVDTVTLDGDQGKYYKELEGKTQDKAKKLLAQRGSYPSILTLLLRMRQACCHSELVEIGEFNTAQREQTVMEGNVTHKYELCCSLTSPVRKQIVESLESDLTCLVCLEQHERNVFCMFSPCGHLICESCVDEFFEVAGETEGKSDDMKAPCPKCKTPVLKSHVIPWKMFDDVCVQNKPKHIIEGTKKKRPTYEVNWDTLEKSPKMVQCMNMVEKIITESDSDKVIIFSQFTSFFDLFQHFLKNELNTGFLRYDGSMSGEARAAVIADFYKKDSKRVLLLSLKAGNVGLTLTCANHVILVDPFWNPFVEEQAMDRAYRIGQTKEVHVHRLLVSNSVEDRIVELQEKKKELVGAAMDEKEIRDVSRLSTRELGFLFGLNALDSSAT